MPHSQFYTRCGDDGTTGLLGPERVPKYELRPEAYGTVDEAQAAMGLARASGCTPRTAQILLAVQRDLHVLMAELAAAGAAGSPFAAGIRSAAGSRSAAGIAAAQVDQLESWIAEVEAQVEMPHEFVVPGDSRPGAALHLARTVVRRAERLAVRLADAELIDNDFLLHYMNRLSSLLFVLACYEDLKATHHAPTPANES